jgi:hypothetical protein
MTSLVGSKAREEITRTQFLSKFIQAIYGRNFCVLFADKAFLDISKHEHSCTSSACFYQIKVKEHEWKCSIPYQ